MNLAQLITKERNILIEYYEKQLSDLNDKYIKLQIKYNELHVDRNILSRQLNESIEQQINNTLHLCKTCNKIMTNENFEEGKMCCDRPRFHNDN